eukprot:4954981-Prymnesium_polylepis.1
MSTQKKERRNLDKAPGTMSGASGTDVGAVFSTSDDAVAGAVVGAAVIGAAVGAAAGAVVGAAGRVV